jgi:hypothetical protein
VRFTYEFLQFALRDLCLEIDRTIDKIDFIIPVPLFEFD